MHWRRVQSSRFQTSHRMLKFPLHPFLRFAALASLLCPEAHHVRLLDLRPSPSRWRTSANTAYDRGSIQSRRSEFILRGGGPKTWNEQCIAKEANFLPMQGEEPDSAEPPPFGPDLTLLDDLQGVEMRRKEIDKALQKRLEEHVLRNDPASSFVLRIRCALSGSEIAYPAARRERSSSRSNSSRRTRGTRGTREIRRRSVHPNTGTLNPAPNSLSGRSCREGTGWLGREGLAGARRGGRWDAEETGPHTRGDAAGETDSGVGVFSSMMCAEAGRCCST